MRRSAAPSQLGSAPKRPRFMSPILASKVVSQGVERSASDILKLINKPAGKEPTENLNNAQELNIDTSDSIEKTHGDEIHSVESRTLGCTELLPVKKTFTSEETENISPSSVDKDVTIPLGTNHIAKSALSRPKFKGFQAPSTTKSTGFQCPTKSETSLSSCVNLAQEVPEGDGPTCNYYNVMWCKMSKKKHKKWEGDAILVTKGRMVSLLDTSGKEIGRGSGYKCKELESLADGQTLGIGGKEIEIMGILSRDDFASGKCFTGGSSDSTTSFETKSLKTLSSGTSKPFSKPQKAGLQQSVATNIPTGNEPIRPRHDPDAPNSLVLPRPSQTHQWEQNKGQLPIVDVVVDPYISQHLRPHQRQGVTFLYECIMGMKNFSGHGAILADEMGLGKTLQCISLIWTLLKQGPYGGKPVVRKVLVITPGSLVKNWLREFKKWLGTERLRVFAVSQDNKVDEFIDSPMYPVLIVSYEMFMRTIEMLRRVKFDLIVCDEGHRLKNTTIKTTTLVSSLPCRKRIVLTGTPVQNDLQELYSIVEFCNPAILGTSSAFRHVYEEPILASRRPSAGPDEVALGEKRAEELNRVTGLFILRRTSDINNKYLPPKVDVVLFCKPSSLQLKLYRKLLSSRAVHSCLYSRDMAQHLMCISALRKLCNMPCLVYNKALEAETSGNSEVVGEDNELELYDGLHSVFPEGYDKSQPEVDEAGKFSVLSQLLAAFNDTVPKERVVLVSNYTQTLDFLEQLCTSCGYKWLRLDGQTPTGKRQQLVERFNSIYSQDFVFLLSSKAGGIGLNLIGACRLILYDIDWNPANDLQAMARIWRDGQRRTVYIYRLLTTGSIEEKMYQRQINKQSLSGVVVDAKASNSNKQVQFSQEDLRDLFTLQEETTCATHDMLGCSCGGSDDNPAENKSKTHSPGRVCQIAHSKKKASKNLCMDELFQWRHQTGPSPNIQIDPVLSEASLEQVSFVFYCQSNATISPTSTSSSDE